MSRCIYARFYSGISRQKLDGLMDYLKSTSVISQTLSNQDNVNLRMRLLNRLPPPDRTFIDRWALRIGFAHILVAIVIVLAASFSNAISSANQSASANQPELVLR